MHVIARCVKIGGPRHQKDLTATDRKSNGKWVRKVLSVGLYSKGGIFTAKKKNRNKRLCETRTEHETQASQQIPTLIELKNKSVY